MVSVLPAAERAGSAVVAALAILGPTRHYRECLGLALSARDGFSVVHSSAFDSSDLARLAVSRPDVALLDFCGVQPLPIMQQIAAARPEAALVALQWDGDDSHALKLFEAGLSGFVPRQASLDDVEAVVRGLLREEIQVPPIVAAAMVRRLRELGRTQIGSAPSDRLSTRELAVLGLMKEGLTNKEIANRLGIEPATVKNHVHRILKKLEVRRRSEAVSCLHR
jgi:DNA-binding NarL/FixJ family response regulator